MFEPLVTVPKPDTQTDREETLRGAPFANFPSLKENLFSQDSFSFNSIELLLNEESYYKSFQNYFIWRYALKMNRKYIVGARTIDLL